MKPLTCVLGSSAAEAAGIHYIKQVVLLLLLLLLLLLAPSVPAPAPLLLRLFVFLSVLLLSPSAGSGGRVRIDWARMTGVENGRETSKIMDNSEQRDTNCRWNLIGTPDHLLQRLIPSIYLGPLRSQGDRHRLEKLAVDGSRHSYNYAPGYS